MFILITPSLFFRDPAEAVNVSRPRFPADEWWNQQKTNASSIGNFTAELRRKSLKMQALKESKTSLSAAKYMVTVSITICRRNSMLINMIKCHRGCVSTYTSSLQTERHRRKTDSSRSCSPAPRKVTRHFSTSGERNRFTFKTHCVYCGWKCDLQKDPKHPSRWRPVYTCFANWTPKNLSLKRRYIFCGSFYVIVIF